MEGLCCLFLFNMCLKLLLTPSKPSETHVPYLTPGGFLYHFKHKMPHNFFYFTGHAKCSYKVSPAALAKFTPPTPQMPRMSLAAPECQRCRRGLKGRRTKASVHPSKVWKASDGNKHWHLATSTLLITHVRTHKCHQGQQSCP